MPHPTPHTILFLLWAAVIHAQPNLTWRHFGPREGMGMGFHELLVDRQGFLWCGSTNGLYRYDGYGFRFLKKYNQSGAGVSSDYINDIAEDEAGDIWVATYSGGVNRWERASGQFHYYRHAPRDTGTICADRVQYLHFGADGQLWLIVRNRSGQTVLDRLDPATGRVVHLRHDPLRPASVGGQTAQLARAGTPLQPLYSDNQGRTWVACRDGLFLSETGKPLRRIPYGEANGTFPIHLYPSPIDSNRVWVLFATADLRRGHLARLDLRDAGLYRQPLPGGLTLQGAPTGIVQSDSAGLWLTDRSLYFLDLEADTFARYTPRLAYETRPDRPWRDSVFHLQADRAGNLWLTFFGPSPAGQVRGSEDYVMPNGLYVFDPGHRSLTFFDRNGVDPKQPLGMVAGLQDDGRGNLWAATYPGFYQLRFSANDQPFQPQFTNYGPEPEGPGEVRDAWEAGPDHLWLAAASGLQRLTLSTGERLCFPADPADAGTIGSDNVVALFADETNGRLWIGHSAGLDWITLEEARAAEPAPRFRHVRDALLDRAEVTEIAAGPPPYLWIGTTTQGLLLFHPLTGKVEKQFLPDPPKPNAISDALINGVFHDRDGHTWVAAGMGGICRLVPQGGSFGFDCHLPGMFITDLYEDRGGRLWLAAMNYGIVILDPATGDYELLTMENGLERSSVLGIEEDQRRRIWFTSLGVTKFDPGSRSYRTFGEAAGIRKEDPGRLFCQLSDGRLVYTAINGDIQVFDPDRVEDNPHPPRPVLTGFFLADRRLAPATDGPLRRNIEVAETVTLAHHQHTFSIEYAGIEMGDPASVRYEYRLEGVDPGWVDAGRERTARYAQLAPGRYAFRVRATNGDGIRSETDASIGLVIRRPWWAQWWAYVLYAGLLFFALYSIYSYRRRRREMKLALEAEQREAERLKELDEAKTRLFTNISHEFRTPLTIISGMAAQVREDPERLLAEGTEMIERNADDLLHLVNQMLDLRKLEAGMMKVETEPRDLISDLGYYLDAFRSLAGLKEVQIHFVTGLESLWLETDPDLLGKILSNLLSNAVKFTPAGGDIYLMVDAGQQLTIRVKDTGGGITEAVLPFIFDRFYQVRSGKQKGPGEGTGIGLALTRELVHLLGGTVTVQSSPGNGTTFLVQLPLRPVEPAPASELPPIRKAAPAPAGGEATAAEITGEELPSLLIVEDNPDVARYLETLLAGKYQLSFAGDGREGIERATAEVPDFIISDVMMPRVDGFELCETLKEDPRTSHIPILLLTARADVASRLQGLRHGADAYLAKPFDKDELLVRIRSLLSLRERLQMRYAGTGQEQGESAPFQREDDFIRKARRIVAENLADSEFGVQQLYQALNLSRTQLHNKLSALTGQSASLFIRRIRLEKGRELVRQTGLSVKEIAFQVGFNDPNYFSRVYRETFGESPSGERGGEG